MSKFDDCIQAAIASGKLSPKMASALRADAEAFEAKLRAEGIHSESQAKAMGVEAAAKFRKEIALRNKYHKVLQHTANEKNMSNMSKHKKSRMAGLMSFLVKDLHVGDGNTPWSNIDNRAKAVEGMSHSLAVDMLNELHTTHLGLKQNKEVMRNTIKELFGESTGDAKAAKAGSAFAKAAEYLRERYNRAGGFIQKRNDWGLTQTHDQAKVSKAAGLKKGVIKELGEVASTKKNMEAWVEFVQPLLNREAMVTPEGRMMTDAELDVGLKEAWNTIRTGGQNKKVAGAFAGAGKLANRHQESRFLVFKDADSWLEYQDVFGNPDSFNVMVGHLRGMSAEIAMLEVLGPNPNAAFNYLADVAKSDGTGKHQDFGRVESVWNVVNGSADMIQINRDALAKGLTTTRHLLMSMHLGSAVISAVSDPMYGKFTRAFNGIPLMKSLTHTLKQLNPASKEDRSFAAHQGMVMDGWTSQALSGARFSGDFDAVGVGSKISEVVFRASGLTAWTQGQRNGFGLDFQWHLGRQMDKPLANVEPKFQAMMRRYGITDDEWEVMRTVPLEEHGGTTYFRPQNLSNLDHSVEFTDNLSTKILEAMNTEMDFAVPVPDARVRSFLTQGGKQRGSAAGEISRSAMMYKSFSLTQFMGHMNRSGPQFAKVYAVRLAIMLTVAGAVSLQMKEITKGRKPRDMTDWSFWYAAMMQGGGLGIFGDFINTSGLTDTNRHGNSPMATLAGPFGSMIEDSLRLAGTGLDLATDPFTGEDTNFAKEATRLGKRYTPFGNVWWARLVLERAIFDNFEEMADPKAKRNRKKFERKMMTERGQEYWWPKGENSPTF